MLRRELRPCVAHRRLKRNHHGLGNALIKRCEIVEYAEQTVRRRSRPVTYFELLQALPHDACEDFEHYGVSADLKIRFR